MKISTCRNEIVPVRYIPFDIGGSLKKESIDYIKNEMEKSGYLNIAITAAYRDFSNGLILIYKLSDNITLYIYKYGVGVISIQDTVFEINTDKYAVDYCESRKKAHSDILNRTDNKYNIIYNITDSLRKWYKTTISRDKNGYIRKSADDTWESQGLSYVMTVSHVKYNCGKISLNDSELKNVLILLEPSIAHAEDFEVYSAAKSNEDLYEFDTEMFSRPASLVKDESTAIYASWAAVITYSNNNDQNYRQLLEILEVDLQAMWLFTHCLYSDLSSADHIKNKISLVELRRRLFTYRRKYSEFLSKDNTNTPTYITDIFNSLVETSGLKTEADKYIEYLNYCIEETESIHAENQRKYSVISEVLLFIIAYVQIAPMIYGFLCGEYIDIKLLPTAIVGLLLIAGIIIIIKKE